MDKYVLGTKLRDRNGHVLTVVGVRNTGYELIYDEHPEKSFSSEGSDDPFLKNYRVLEEKP